MLKLAYFSPLPPIHSGISDYSRSLLDYLTLRAQVDLWVDGFAPTDVHLQRACGIIDYDKEPERLMELARYDGVIYHQSNEIKYHRRIYEVALLYPGVNVIHDFSLHPFLATYWLDYKKDGQGYLDEMTYSHGEAGLKVARATLAECQAGHWDQTPWEIAPMRYPLNRRLLRRSKGVVVHSDFAKERIEEMEPALPVATIAHVRLDPEMPQATPSLVEDLRRYSGIILASLGFSTNHKGLDTALKAFAAIRKQGVEAVYLLVGEIMPSCPLTSTLNELGLTLGEEVLTTGFVEDAKLLNLYLGLAHICINLRRRTMGETSGIAVRALALGKPLIVSDIGWFGDLPNDCVVKLSGGRGEADRLARFLLELCREPALRNLLGENARRYAEQHCMEAMIADQYMSFCRDVSSRSPLDPHPPTYLLAEIRTTSKTSRTGAADLDRLVQQIEQDL